MTDCQLYRLGGLTVTKRWPEWKMVDITDWASSETKSVTICSYLPGFKFQTQVRKFVPREGDIMEKRWMDGKERKTYKVTPYALANMERSAKDFQKAVDERAYEGYGGIFERDNTDPLIRLTLKMAMEHLKTAQVSFDPRRDLES
jgi:hypothetical protein